MTASQTGLVARVRAAIAELGLGWAVLYAMNVVLQASSGGRMRILPYLLYAQPIGADAYRGVRDEPNTSIAPVGPSAEVVSAFPRPPAVIAERFATGAVCYVATVKGRFGGFVWIDPHDHDEDEVRCRYRMPADGSAVWDFDVYVEPELRLGRTMARLWKAVDATLGAQGVRWSFSRISAFNRPSIGSHERLGARRVGRAVFLVCGRVQLAWLSSAPYLHLALGAHARPDIWLRAP